MSTLKVGTIQSNTASTPPTIQDSAGTQVGTFCRAWVNFNGTGTVAIRASFNVTSITDNNTGDYTVNFTNAMPDANYGAQINSDRTTNYPIPFLASQTSSSVRINTTQFNASTATPTDVVTGCVAIFR